MVPKVWWKIWRRCKINFQSFIKVKLNDLSITITQLPTHEATIKSTVFQPADQSLDYGWNQTNAGEKKFTPCQCLFVVWSRIQFSQLKLQISHLDVGAYTYSSAPKFFPGKGGELQSMHVYVPVLVFLFNLIVCLFHCLTYYSLTPTPCVRRVYRCPPRSQDFS